MPLHNDPLIMPLPYPDSPPPRALEDQSYFQMSDSIDLAEVQQTKKMIRPPSTGSEAAVTGGGVKLPASLRIGEDSCEGSRSPPRGGGEMWMNFQKDEAKLPDSLRAGAGVVGVTAPEGRRENTSMHGALETDPEANPWSREKGAQEFRMHGGLNNVEEGQDLRTYGDLPKLLPLGDDDDDDDDDDDEWDMDQQNIQTHGDLPASLPAPVQAPGGGEPLVDSISMDATLSVSLPESLPAPLLAGSGEPTILDMNTSPWAGSGNSSPAPQMTANLNSSDRPFSEYSPFYNPPTSFAPLPAATPIEPPTAPTTIATTLANLEISPRRPSISATTSTNSELKGRQHSIASSISSVGFEPGVDVSSFDASNTRAFPGRRGYPSIGMDGWAEDDTEGDVAKTWEEELDRRAKAGAALQKRTEQAAERDREERLQAEFWEEERRLGAMPVVAGPQKPPKPALPARQPTPESQPVFPPPPPLQPAASPVPPPLPARQPQPSATTTTEIYQIKHITWLSPAAPRSSSAVRHSPILLQADNGPCPLLALVNALILSTPAGTTTTLISILQEREQVSLELLLDAVFQELMDRGGATGLPDVSDLFAFLLTLHTGMNVNPRFYRAEDSRHQQSEYADFEHTREMELYGAFKVPLVHGWLPEASHPAVAAMKRRKTANYEDAQTLLFVEEEIITRITTAGAALAPGEDQIIEDATLIREFMENSKTQLTSYGLETVRGRLKPGDVAILFRNDHFMTVIGARDGGALHGLVTDAGFATHEEVVWERMVDVQGHGNGFLSGDFRPVGGQDLQQQQRQHVQQRPVRSLLDPDEGWETVPDSIANESLSIGSRLDAGLPGLVGGPDPDATGHDADLALAMMLQEEEDEQHRREQERRRAGAALQPARNVQPAAAPLGNLPPPPPLPLPPPPPPPPPPPRGPGPQTHRPADPAETTPPPPYERVPGTTTRPTPTTYIQRENMSAYQSMARQQQQQQPGWPPTMHSTHGRSASTPGGLVQGAGGGLTSVQRQQAARGLLQEIVGSSAGSSAGARRSSGGMQGGVGGPGGPGGPAQGGRRQSISGPGQDDKDKCVIC